MLIILQHEGVKSYYLNVRKHSPIHNAGYITNGRIESVAECSKTQSNNDVIVFNNANRYRFGWFE